MGYELSNGDPMASERDFAAELERRRIRKAIAPHLKELRRLFPNSLAVARLNAINAATRKPKTKEKP
jgi:hypothetical protein